MANIALRIIRPIESAAEKEYIKEFFRFVGCFVSDYVVDAQGADSWEKCLVPENNKENKVDVVINYFGKDPYADVCQQLSINRIYCYVDFETNALKIAMQPDLESPLPEDLKNKASVRKYLLNGLIQRIWADDEKTRAEILEIAAIYLGEERWGNLRDEMFYFLQAKRCLRVLSMAENSNDFYGKTRRLPLVSYIWHTISVLWDMCIHLRGKEAPYSIYTRVNAASMIREIADALYGSEKREISNIIVKGEPCRLLSDAELVADMNRLLKIDRQFVTAYLLLANLHRRFTGSVEQEAYCYSKILTTGLGDDKEYAFVWHWIAYYSEHRMGNRQKALEAHQMTIQLNPQYYPAFFKLGYYAITEGRYDEAETWLRRAIKAIFCGRSTDPDKDGIYRNWLMLSLKDSQYVFRAYMLLAKLAIDTHQEQAAKTYVVRACMAAVRFSEATLVRNVMEENYDSDEKQEDFERFEKYHKIRSLPVRMMWMELKPWSEFIVNDYFVRDTVKEYLEKLTL